jgi:hypothetical protein
VENLPESRPPRAESAAPIQARIQRRAEDAAPVENLPESRPPRTESAAPTQARIQRRAEDAAPVENAPESRPLRTESAAPIQARIQRRAESAPLPSQADANRAVDGDSRSEGGLVQRGAERQAGKWRRTPAQPPEIMPPVDAVSPVRRSDGAASLQRQAEKPSQQAPDDGGQEFAGMDLHQAMIAAGMVAPPTTVQRAAEPIQTTERGIGISREEQEAMARRMRAINASAQQIESARPPTQAARPAETRRTESAPPPMLIQRTPATATQASQPDEPPQQADDLDMQQLARDVYRVLKDRLRMERRK